VGLGDVNAAYLENIASAGNGEFVYVSDSESLSIFYDRLRNQVTNQYLLTYKAKNATTQTGRSIRVEINENKSFDYKEYSLIDDRQSSENVYTDESGLHMGTLSVTGLNIRQAYKSTMDIPTFLQGANFKKEDVASLRLVGDSTYDISMEFVNETSYKVVIPSSVAIGTYDLEVRIGNETAYLVNGFSLWENGDTEVTKFGPYIFKSVEKKTSGQKVVLSGNVVMNDWLHFNGKLSLEGDLKNDNSVKITDLEGSYVIYDETSARGVGAYFAKKGIAVNIPKLGSFNLYNSEQNVHDYSNYQVDSITTVSFFIPNVMTFNKLTVNLYPNNFKIQYSAGNSELSVQEWAFCKTKLGAEDPFEFQFAGDIVVTNQNVGIVLDWSSEKNKEKYREIRMMNSLVELDMNRTKIYINTIENKYALGGMIKIKAWDLGIGAEVNLVGFDEEGLKLDGVKLLVDKDATFYIGQVPVTFSDGVIGAEEGLANAVKTKNFSGVTFIGQLDAEVAKTTAYFPELEDYVDDISLVSFEDATVKFRWNPFVLSTSSTIKLFDTITLAEPNLEIGNFSYTNELTGLYSQDVIGLRASIKSGFMWDIDDCNIDISGIGEVVGTNRFIGVQVDGLASIKVQWWFFNKQLEKSGTVLVGVYFTEAKEPQFTLALRYEGVHNKNKKIYYHIDKDGNARDGSGVITFA